MDRYTKRCLGDLNPTPKVVGSISIIQCRCTVETCSYPQTTHFRAGMAGVLLPLHLHWNISQNLNNFSSGSGHLYAPCDRRIVVSLKLMNNDLGQVATIPSTAYLEDQTVGRGENQVNSLYAELLKLFANLEDFQRQCPLLA